MAEYIKATDTLNGGRQKINDALTTANDTATDANVTAHNADSKASAAVNTANTANAKSDDTQQQLNTIVINNGQSDAEVLQARGGYPVLNERLNGVDAQLADMAIDVKVKGASGDGVTDDTQAIQSAYDSLTEGQTLLIPNGTFTVTNLVFNRDHIRIDCRGVIQQESSASGVAVTIGSMDKNTFGVIGTVKLKKQTRDWTQDNTGLKLLNCNECNLKIDISDFTNSVVLESNAFACTYNEIAINLLKNGKKNLSLIMAGSGDPSECVNENKFYAGRFQWNSGLPDTDRYHIYIPDVSMNNNVFFSPSLESVDGGTLIYCNGEYNHFYSPRLEADTTTTKVKLGAQSMYNQLIYPYAHTDISTDSTYIDIGTRNHIYGRDEVQLKNSIVKAAAFSAKGNPKQNSAWGNVASFEAQSTATSTDKLFRGLDSSGNETFFVDGNGSAKVKDVTLGDGTLKLLSTGVFDGAFSASSSYVTKGMVPWAVVSSVPTSSSPKIGTPVFCTADNKLYVHIGGGNWKSVAFS